jgi:hypothetical protein
MCVRRPKLQGFVMSDGIKVVEHQTPRGERFEPLDPADFPSVGVWALRNAYENGRRHGYRRGLVAGLMLWAGLVAAGASLSLYHAVFR